MTARSFDDSSLKIRSVTEVAFLKRAEHDYEKEDGNRVDSNKLEHGRRLIYICVCCSSSLRFGLGAE